MPALLQGLLDSTRGQPFPVISLAVCSLPLVEGFATSMSSRVWLLQLLFISLEN